MEELRAAILAEMQRQLNDEKASLPKMIWYCTWWFKFAIPHETKVIRRELERMEQEGLVVSDRSQSNNTRWRLTIDAQEA